MELSAGPDPDFLGQQRSLRTWGSAGHVQQQHSIVGANGGSPRSGMCIYDVP